MRGRLHIIALIVAVVWTYPGRAIPITVCSFNIQFLGSSKQRDDDGLADLLKNYDIVVVQELIAPPYAGKFPNGEPYVPDPEARHFFECMKQKGFTNRLSEEDTGPGLKIHLNSTATEWWVAFYKADHVKIATDLPSGFLSKTLAHNQDFDRVPYAFGFRTMDGSLEFVLISVHLEPGFGKANKQRRKHELATIASWIAAHDQPKKDFIVVGDMNIANLAELTNAIPVSFLSLNVKCLPTNTNVNDPRPYDHVMCQAAFNKDKYDAQFGFHIENLIDAMREPWNHISTKKYPGGPPYTHNQFRKYYSDHHPVAFRIISPYD